MADNTITVVGNLTRDPEMRYTAGGQAKATLGVAVSRRWTNRQTNETEERTSFFNVVVWGEMADHCSESLQKGMRIVVTGRGGHASDPSRAADPIPTACAIVQSLQTIVSRNLDPIDTAVISITQFHGGDAWNVIPEEVVLRGTVRAFREQTQTMIEKRIREIAGELIQVAAERALRPGEVPGLREDDALRLRAVEVEHAVVAHPPRGRGAGVAGIAEHQVIGVALGRHYGVVPRGQSATRWLHPSAP